MKSFLPIIFLLCLSCFSTLTSARQINAAGLKLIKEFEGFFKNFYIDPVGIKTIGYGHACHVNDCSKIHPPITEAQGSELLRKDLVSHESCIQKAAPFLNDNQFSACASFSFNLGCPAFTGSTLLKHIKAKNYHAAAGEFGKWVHGGGKVLPGLVRRRKAERDLFCSGGVC